ncbi:MAG TPA: hypothetical protein PLP17_08320 [Oligoflexia bacterium]|nr:hypothetical protein [Oligoflexia bacterium]
MKTFLFSTVLLVICGACSACGTKPSERRPERNVIKDYVNKPREKAHGAKRLVETSQEKTRREAQEMDD